MDVGVRVRLRDAVTLDDLGAVSAPAPVRPEDVLADVADVYRVEAVLVPPPGARFVRCSSAESEEVNERRPRAP